MFHDLRNGNKFKDFIHFKLSKKIVIINNVMNNNKAENFIRFPITIFINILRIRKVLLPASKFDIF